MLTSWKNDIEKFGNRNRSTINRSTVSTSGSASINGGVNAKNSANSNFDVHVHHGEKAAREESFYEWYRRIRRSYSHTAHSSASASAHSADDTGHARISLLFTTYDMAIKDVHLLRKLNLSSHPWQYLIVRICCCYQLFYVVALS